MKKYDVGYSLGNATQISVMFVEADGYTMSDDNTTVRFFKKESVGTQPEAYKTITILEFFTRHIVYIASSPESDNAR